METSTPMKYSQIKPRIKRSQAQAKTLGFFFLLGTLAITTLACFALASVDGVALGVAAFWKPFVTLFSGNVLVNFKGNAEAVIVAVLYSLMLITLLINLIRSLTKLGWLFKRKASKLYGFNRNMYAMEALAKIFSQSFSCIIAYHLLIALVTGGIALSLLGIITLIFGAVWHLLLTPFVGNVSLYTTENGITEVKREVGNFAPIFRNVLQMAALSGIAICFVKYIIKTDILGGAITVLTERGLKAFIDVPRTLIVPGVCLLLTFFIIGMLSYVFGIKEFDSEGAKERGRKTNLVMSLLVFLTTVATYVVGMILIKAHVSVELIYVALIALGMFVLEILLCKYPRVPVENDDEVSIDEYLKKDEAKYGEKKDDTKPAPVAPYPYYPQLPQTASVNTVQQPVAADTKKAYCANCGKQVDVDVEDCPHCGYSEAKKDVEKSTNDSPSGGLAFLGFCFPIVGFIIFLACKRRLPKRAKSAGKGALIGAIVSTVAYIVFEILWICVLKGMY